MAQTHYAQAGWRARYDDDEDDGELGLLFPEVPRVDHGFTIKTDSYVRSCAVHQRHVGQPKELTLSLLKKHHSLWGEYVYNAARVIADRLDSGEIDVKGKRVLELGAGAGLPGLIAALNGASHSVISDYADADLIRVIDLNIDAIAGYHTCSCSSVGFTFGDSPEVLTRGGGLFDVVLMADLIFNRSEHRKLLASLRDCLEPNNGQGWCVFSHHDPAKHLLDLNFFELARSEFGLTVTRMGEEERKSWPFVMKDGLDDKRGVVNIYLLRVNRGGGEQM